MPHFRFRAVEPEVVRSLSKTLTDDLAIVMQSPREDFTFELIHTTFFYDGHPDSGYPFVELFWFDRGQAVQDKVATVVTQQLKAFIGQEHDVAVIFTVLNPNQYYDNAAHY